MGVLSYKDLLVWQKAVDLAVHCYEITRRLPPEERYGLSSQIRRAGASVPANIAEGHARNHSKEYVRYLRMARGSIAELETHVTVACRLGMLDVDATNGFFARADEVGRMISGLEASITRRVRDSQHPATDDRLVPEP